MYVSSINQTISPLEGLSASVGLSPMTSSTSSNSPTSSVFVLQPLAPPTASHNASSFFTISTEGKTIATMSQMPTVVHNITEPPAASVSPSSSGAPSASVTNSTKIGINNAEILDAGAWSGIDVWFADTHIYIVYGFVGAIICIVPLLLIYKKHLYGLVITKKKKSSLLPSISTNPLYTTNLGNGLAHIERRRSISNELIKYNKVKTSPLIRSATCPDMASQA